MHSESFNVGFGEVLVQLPQVEDGQHDAEEIYQDPDGIENIVSVGTLEMSDWDDISPWLLLFLPELEDKMVHPSQPQRLLLEHHWEKLVQG